ncbi:MAG TPA: PP2C family protein-serine/threonine phosphatase, partial [Tepidisphaeraceae bacterium]|nr:PP2C family protein-serine/threonine phosphatase [Tepidisphaeraceae bacterium]
MALFFLLYLIAFVWAWRARRTYRETIRLATVLFLIGGIWSVMLARGFMRPMIEIGVSKALQEDLPEPAPPPPTLAFENFEPMPISRDRADRPPSLATSPDSQRREIQSDDRPIRFRFGPNTIDTSKPLPPQANKAIVDVVQFTTWLILAGLLFLNHLLVCLFIPWKVRESIVPSVLVVCIALVVVVLDHIAQPTPASLFFVALILIAASITPGTLICWWRFSRFNKSFKLNYESNRFRQMERELEGARTIHESVLPAPKRDGPLRMEYVYEPMRQIGGDMLFIHSEPQSQVLHALILDVTGHGVAAALTLNRVMGEIERSFAEHPDAAPEKIIANLNRYIHLTLSRHAIFVTAIALRIDPNTHKVQYVNAGHPTAFIVRADLSRQKLETTSMLLGAVEGPEFELETKTLDFKFGDALIAYTDGASEATNENGEMLYIEGVERIIAGVS